MFAMFVFKVAVVSFTSIYNLGSLLGNFPIRYSEAQTKDETSRRKALQVHVGLERSACRVNGVRSE